MTEDLEKALIIAIGSIATSLDRIAAAMERRTTIIEGEARNVAQFRDDVLGIVEDVTDQLKPPLGPPAPTVPRPVPVAGSVLDAQRAKNAQEALAREPNNPMLQVAAAKQPPK